VQADKTKAGVKTRSGTTLHYANLGPFKINFMLERRLMTQTAENQGFASHVKLARPTQYLLATPKTRANDARVSGERSFD
jgi:hypothetical protein